MVEKIVGLAWDDETLRAAELTVRGQRSRVHREIERVATVELPAGTVDQGEIVDPEAFTQSLRTLWSESEFSTKRVALGLDARATVIRRADLPILDKSDFQQAAAYEMGDLLNYPLSDALVSALEVGRSSETTGASIQTLILAVKQQSISDAWAAAQRAGLRPVSTELIQAALVSAINEPVPLADDSLGVMVDISRHVTNVMIHDNDGLLLTRVVTAGVGAESSLSDELQMELEMLSGFGQDANPIAADVGHHGVMPEITTVMEGIRRTLHYCSSEVDQRPIGRIVLCGPKSGAAGLAHGLADSFPSAQVLHHDRAQWPEADQRANEFDEAVAVAHAALTPASGRSFDLVPRTERERRTKRISVGLGLAAALLVASLLVGDSMDRLAEIDGETTVAEGIERGVDELRTQLYSFSDDVERKDFAQEQTSRVVDLLEEDLSVGNVVQQVAEAMPADTFLLEMRLSRAGSEEPPTGYGGPSPRAVLTLTGVAEDLDGVGRWMQSVEQVPVLDGIWLAQSTIGSYDSGEGVGAVFTIDAAVVEATDSEEESEIER